MSDPRGRALFQTERHREIVSVTMEDGRVDVRELAERFQVTTETIRRDLSDLQEQRLLRRVHGGAIPWETGGFEPLLAVRNDRQDAEKRRIARLAAQELADSRSIIIDSGSTLTRFAEALPHDRELKVVTNSLLTAQVLADRDLIDVIVLGGTLQKDTLAMVDAQAVSVVQELAVDTLFISCDGASLAGGLTTPFREEAALKRAMIAAADRVVALVDHTKMGNDHFIRFADWTDIDVVITDVDADEAVVAALVARGLSVHQA